MAHPKPLKQLSDDELLEVASQSGKGLKLTFDNDAAAFLYNYDIRPGVNQISKLYIYRIYKAWSKIQWNESRFMREVKKILPETKKFFLTDADPFKLVQLAESLETPKLTERSNYAKFLDKYSIRPGEYLIEDHILYFYYDRDRHNRRLKTGSKLLFNRALKQRLEHKFYKNMTFFKINPTEIKIPREKVQQLRESYARKKIKKIKN